MQHAARHTCDVPLQAGNQFCPFDILKSMFKFSDTIFVLQIICLVFTLYICEITFVNNLKYVTLQSREKIAQIFQGEMPCCTWHRDIARVATKPPY